MKTYIVLCIASLMVLTGCSTLRPVSLKTENTTHRNYNKILVLALTHEKNNSMQQEMEDHLTGDLSNLGYTAISSLKEFGPNSFGSEDEQTVLQQIKNNGFDAVVTIVLLDKEIEKKYMPEQTYNYKHEYRYVTFSWYYPAGNRELYAPGYYTTGTNFLWESNFYDMSDQSLVYSVLTKSVSPSTAASMGHEYGQWLVKNMIEENIIYTPANN